MACKRYLVSGRVQGVWFRQSTRDQAKRFGLRCQAINLPDGRVEVIACGDGQNLEKLETWLWQGPPLARVGAVEKEDIEIPDIDS